MIKFYPVTHTIQKHLICMMSSEFNVLLTNPPLTGKPRYEAFALRTITKFDDFSEALAYGLLGTPYDYNTPTRIVQTLRNSWNMWIVLNKNPDQFMLRATFTPYRPKGRRKDVSEIFNLVAVDVLPKKTRHRRS